MWEALQQTQNWTLSEPRWFWLLLLLPIFGLVHRFSLVSFHTAQKKLSLFLRCFLLCLLVLALAGFSSKRFQRDIALVIAVDVSPSIPSDALLVAEKEIKQLISQLPSQMPYWVVSFAQTVRKIAESKQKKWTLARHKGENNTQLENVFRFAKGLFPQGKIPRIIVYSDGNETMGNSLSFLSGHPIPKLRVFTRLLSGKDRPEVLIQSVHTPEKIRLNASFVAKVRLLSTVGNNPAVLNVYKNEFLLKSQKIQLKKGLQTVPFELHLTETGTTVLKVVVKAEKDTFTKNNQFLRFIPIRGKPKVLYLEGTPSQGRYFVRALQKQQIHVEIRSSFGIPNNLQDLTKYDLVILSDIPAYRISSRQMSLLEKYVKDWGGGLIMVGGENSFGPGGYSQTRMERLLPVRFDNLKKKEDHSLALVMVIDKSGSMSGQRMQLAKEAAKVTVTILGNNAQVGVIAFDGSPTVMVPLQSTRNKNQIIYNISRIHASGGTAIVSALKSAYQMLSGVRAKIKHVILLSDGQDSRTGMRSVLQSMNGEKITVSTVGVGSGSDQSMLRSIAEMGGGRYYFTEDPYSIPKIFTKETAKVSKTSFVEEPFRPRIKSYSQLLKGISFQSMPYLLGYVSTQAKKGAQVILQSEQKEPLLVSWRRGLGRVMAFTSDIKPRWSAQWIRKQSFGKFWAQVIRVAMKQSPSKSIQVQVQISEGKGKIQVDALDSDGNFLNHLLAEAIVLDPSLEKSTAVLRQTGPGFYEGSFVPKRHGAYMVSVYLKDAKGNSMAYGQGTSSYSFSPEFLLMNPNLQRLKEIATMGEGLLNPAKTEIFKLRKTDYFLSFFPLWPYLLWLALVLFLFDVSLRRIRWFGDRLPKN